MAKKGELNADESNTDENDEIQNDSEKVSAKTKTNEKSDGRPSEKKPSSKSGEVVNIMATDDAHEPTKSKKQDKESISEAVDLSPVLEKIDEGFKQITQGLIPKTSAKKEDKFEEDFLGPLGSW